MTKSKISISKDILPLLMANKELVEATGGNIYPLYAPEGVTDDFIIYARTGGGSETTTMGVADETCEETFNVVSSDYVKGTEIAEMLRSVLQDITINNEPLTMTDSREDYVGDGNIVKYVQILVFSVGKDSK